MLVHRSLFFTRIRMHKFRSTCIQSNTEQECRVRYGLGGIGA